MIESRDAERYVAGALSDEEAARFEEAMIDRPDLAADVNVRRRIKAGLSQLEKNHELEALLAQERRQPKYLAYAAAAAVLLVVMAGLFTFSNREGAAPLQALLNSSEMGVKPVATSFILANTRSADEPVFEVQRNGGPIRLQILVDGAAAAPFEVNLFATGKPAGAVSFDDSSIPQTADGFAVVYLDPRGLDSGSYTLSLKSPSGVEQRFPFTLAVKP